MSLPLLFDLNLDTEGPPWQPTVDDLGLRLYARTLTRDGARIGTFNDETSPTGRQAEALIEDAVAMVSGTIGAVPPEAQWPLFRHAVIARAAMNIERGYYPSGEDTGDSTYRDWEDEYTAAIAALTTALNDDQPNRPRFGTIGLARPRRGINIGAVETPVTRPWMW